MNGKAQPANFNAIAVIYTKRKQLLSTRHVFTRCLFFHHSFRFYSACRF